MAQPIDISGDEIIDVSGDEFVQTPQQKPQTSPGGPASMGISPGIPQNARYDRLAPLQGFVGNMFPGNLAQKLYQDGRTLGKKLGLVDDSQVSPKPFQWPAQEQGTGTKVAAALAGGLATPSLAGVTGAAQGLGVLGTAALGAAQGGLMGGLQAADEGGDVAQGAKYGAAIGGGIPLAAGGMTKLGSFLSRKLGAASFDMVRQIATKILNKQGRIDAQTMQDLTKAGTSKFGFENRMDDLIYIVTNKLQPKVFEGVPALMNRMGGILADAENAYGGLRDPIRKMNVDAQGLVGKLESTARNLSEGRLGGFGDQAVMDPHITKGPDAAGIIRGEIIPQYESAAQLARPTVGSIGDEGPVLPQQIPGFNVEGAQAPWAPPAIDPTWGEFASGAKIPNQPTATATALNQKLNPQDYQYIVPPKPNANLTVPSAKPGTKAYEAQIAGNKQSLAQRDQAWGQTQSQAPAWLTGQDVGPSGGSEASWAAFDKINQVPTREGIVVPPATNRSLVPLENLDRARGRLRSSEYEPAGKMSDPNQAKEEAARGMQEVFLSYGTPEQRQAIEAGRVPYEQVKDTSDVFMQNWAGTKDKTGHGLAQTVQGSVLNKTFNAASDRMNIMKHSVAKSIADRALAKMNKRLGTNVAQDTSYFENQTIKSMFQQIAQMDEKDARVYSYVASMTNPAFRKAWMAAQEDGNDD